eukprot:TRINITY_DN3315_c0_g1_i4.p1 TRINITY_DN3315_c0_g1~~TRINITY_DN3315_c0_g1_i4.p1  ORF type:complete len:163 (+),score=1.08 TRINITY_DN3315_c0_g1_i4:231-719(+)
MSHSTPNFSHLKRVKTGHQHNQAILTLGDSYVTWPTVQGFLFPLTVNQVRRHSCGIPPTLVIKKYLQNWQLRPHCSASLPMVTRIQLYLIPEVRAVSFPDDLSETPYQERNKRASRQKAVLIYFFPAPLDDDFLISASSCCSLSNRLLAVSATMGTSYVCPT